jgi:hypothetical protein
MNEKRRAYTEAETESLLKLCRRNGYGMTSGAQFFPRPDTAERGAGAQIRRAPSRCRH